MKVDLLLPIQISSQKCFNLYFQFSNIRVTCRGIASRRCTVELWFIFLLPELNFWTICIHWLNAWCYATDMYNLMHKSTQFIYNAISTYIPKNWWNKMDFFLITIQYGSDKMYYILPDYGMYTPVHKTFELRNGGEIYQYIILNYIYRY